MDLRSSSPFPLLRHGIINSFHSLDHDIKADVAIIGAGISGALTAWYLFNAGLDVVVIDRRHAGMGSTAASTALLQYEIDTPLRVLAEKTGKTAAEKSYRSGIGAIRSFGKICEELGVPGVFVKRPSLQFASYAKDVGCHLDEFHLRKKAGISVRWLDECDLKAKFGLTRKGGILSRDAAEADVYRITHLILKRLCEQGARVFDNTEVVEVRQSRRQSLLKTATKRSIRAKRLVIACGYESQRFLPKRIENLSSTFAIASEPLKDRRPWYKNALIWETASPYLYLRTTTDNRIIVGGKDVPFSDPDKRDRLIPSKRRALESAFKRLFPHIPFTTDFCWAGTFASTKDGLPYIGKAPGVANTWFALGFGGNGITFSVIAGEIIRDELLGRKNEMSEIFSFQR